MLLSTGLRLVLTNCAPLRLLTCLLVLLIEDTPSPNGATPTSAGRRPAVTACEFILFVSKSSPTTALIIRNSMFDIFIFNLNQKFVFFLKSHISHLKSITIFVFLQVQR